jgi:plasmid stability protein
MASMTIRNLDESLKRRLRRRAAEHNRSMEEEVRVILAEALPANDGGNLFDRIRARIEPLGGFDLPEREHEQVGEPIRLDE